MKIKRWDVSVLESKKVDQKHDADFFTTDTDAWVEIQLVDEGISPTSATIVAYNQCDKSLVEEDHPVENNLIKFPFYTEERSLIEHSGGWLLTVIFVHEGKRYTTREMGVYVNDSLGDDIPAKLEIVEDWNRIKNEVEIMKAAEEVRQELYNEVKHKLESGELQGEEGPAGDDGYTPIKGVDYFDGEQGPKGDDGERGPQGEQGPAGEDGYTPIKGVDYFDGEQGPKGEDGYTPIKGVDYFDGLQGPVGPPPTWVVISADEYDAITPDPQTVYLVTGANQSELDMYKQAVNIMLGGE